MNESPISNPFDEDEKSGRRPVVWAILGLTVVCLGAFVLIVFLLIRPDPQSLIDQYFPSPTNTLTSTPSQMPTASSTPTRTATPTLNFTGTSEAKQATDTAVSYQATADSVVSTWDIVLIDAFDSNRNNWLVDSSDDEYAFTNYEIVDGKYRWDATAHKSLIGWIRTDQDKITDFYLSVEIQQVEGPDSADYGVIFREDDNSNFYYFGITNQGQYVFHIFFEEWDTLIDWTQTELIRSGKSNRLTVIGEGSHFTFFINDQYLTEITNNKIPEGITALAIELSNEDDHAVFEFDNFELRTP